MSLLHDTNLSRRHLIWHCTKIHKILGKECYPRDINYEIKNLLFFIFSEERDYNLIFVTRNNFRESLEHRERSRKSAELTIEKIKHVSIENNALSIEC